MHEGATEIVDGFFLDERDRSALLSLVEDGTRVIIQPVAQSSTVTVDSALLQGTDR